MTYKEYLDQNYPLYTHGGSKRKIRHDFFKNITSELHAYLLGLIMSDGSINDKRATLSYNINPKDKELHNYFKVISPDAYVQNCKSYESKATINGKTIKNNGSVRLAIASIILIEDLHKLGIMQNKTYQELHIPKMDKKFIRHFIRGYFDGDGWITYSIRKPNPKNREKNYRVSASAGICGKTENIFKEIQKVLEEENIIAHINYEKRNDMFKIVMSSRETLKKFYSYLYKNVNFYLKRKFNKFNYYVNTEVSQIITEYRNAQEVNVNESNNPPTSSEHPTNEDEDIC